MLASSPHPTPAVSGEPPSQAASDVAKHALRLVDEALASGDYPAAAGCMNLLFKGAANLPSSSLLQAVHLRMVQCGMAEDANDLLSRHAVRIDPPPPPRRAVPHHHRIGIALLPNDQRLCF